jgi:hypothetical protein
VIEGFIDPGSDYTFQLREIDCHAQGIQFFGLDSYHGFSVVSVQVPALSGVVQQPVTVTEVNLFGNAVHEKLIVKSGWLKVENGLSLFLME